MTKPLVAERVRNGSTEGRLHTNPRPPARAPETKNSGAIAIGAQLLVLLALTWAVAAAVPVSVTQSATSAWQKSPAVTALVASLVLFLFNQIWHKLTLYIYGLLIMLFGRDKRWKKTPDPAEFGELFRVGEPMSKRIIFIRHGESRWNEVFNRGICWLPFGLVKGSLQEFMLLSTSDSVFFDSPLNHEGMGQAKALGDFLKSDRALAGDPGERLRRDIAALRGDPGAPEVVLCSSNLRRAMQTILLALPWRIRGIATQKGSSRQQVKILSSLQEMTTNVDGVVIAPAGTVDPLPMMQGVESLPLSDYGRDVFDATLSFDPSENAGQKGIRAKGIDRIEQFCEWCFRRPEDVIVAAGHSLYFRYFFKTFLPHASMHASKTKKMANGAAVGMTLQRVKDGRGRPVYRVLEDSITTIYLGFSGR